MDPKQKDLIRTSWALVEPIEAQAAALFYRRLFELDPAIATLFGGTDMATQGQRLTQTLRVVVRGLDRLDELTPAVQALGRRHVGYRVQPAHYATVGQALLWTLEAGLGEAFTPEVRDAWATAYGLLSSLMVAAAEESHAPSSPALAGSVAAA